MRIGEWLIAESIIDAGTLGNALTLQRRSGSLLGEILLAGKHISPLQWLKALASQGIATLSGDALWSAHTPMRTAEDLTHYIEHSYVPLAACGSSLSIATPKPTEALRLWCEQHYKQPCVLALITMRDFHHYLLEHFGDALNTHACNHLYSVTPDFSAKKSITPSQCNGLLAILVIISACIAFAPIATWYGTIIITTLFYLSTLAFKLLLLISMPLSSRRHKIWQHTADSMDDSTLPVYSILVPLYRESPAVLAQILTAIDALDYPKSKLDVWLITEADDPHTREHLVTLQPPDYCRILAVPTSLPRTKPKACNVALPLVRGEFITIYDAEDKPNPGQLRLSVAAFAHSRRRVACMQAPLNYYNRDENLLTRLFAIEYSALFTLFLPALRRLRIPIPLGGTSNHIRTSALRAVHGWDPYNVTEDADLGIRLAYHGYSTDILPSLTLEESPISCNAWLKQRSRWIKGYMQTWLVYMRDPLSLLQQLGAPAFFGFQLFVGAPTITFLLAPLFWGCSILMLSGLAPALLLPGWLMLCCALTLVLGFALQWATAIIAVRHEGWHKLKTAQLLYPLYWLLHSVACVKALWQLAFKPHYWEKTTHGTSRLFKNLQSNG